MKYVVIDAIKDGDVFTTECETQEEALKKAEEQWFYINLSKHDKARRQAFYVLESANPDDEADNHLDGRVIKSWM